MWITPRLLSSFPNLTPREVAVPSYFEADLVGVVDWLYVCGIVLERLNELLGRRGFSNSDTYSQYL